MMINRHNFLAYFLSPQPRLHGTTKRLTARLVWRYSFAIALGLAFSLQFANPSFGQRPGAGTTRNFTLWGDVKLDESHREDDRPVTFDVILYTRGNDVFGRQRVAANGRYRFINIFNGDYYLAIELDSVELARMPLVISGQYADDIRQDINLEWKAIAGRVSGGVVSAADSYDRSANNKALYQKSTREISSKKYPEAIATLRELVTIDPKDFPAWSDLGMVYFIQKDLEAAETSFGGAATAKPSYFPALLSMGRVRLARKNYEGAVESLEAALKVDPKSANANYFLGEAYLQLKKGTKAVGYLNAALALDPVGMAEAHLRLATLYNGAGYKDKAALEYEEFLKKKPDYADRKKLEEYIAQNKKS